MGAKNKEQGAKMREGSLKFKVQGLKLMTVCFVMLTIGSICKLYRHCECLLMSVLRYVINDKRTLLAQELSETSLVPPVASRTSEPPHLSNRTTLARVRGGHFSPSAIVRIIVGFLLFSSCAKDKVDFAYDHSPEVHETAAARIVNLLEYSQVIANGDTLTNYSNSGVPTRYFPEFGWLDNTWRVPQQLFGQTGRIDFVLTDFEGRIDKRTRAAMVNRASQIDAAFSVPGGGTANIDYYALWPGGSGQAYVVPVERDETPPSRPDYFKVRILNLAKSVEPLLATQPSYTGPLEDLVGPITLAYADGTPVSAQTSNISLAQRASDYIELPYGTYQFKILTADGRQVSATLHGTWEYPDGARRLDPASSRIPAYIPQTGNSSQVTGLTYAPIQTYQPGGVYTLVVAPFGMMYNSPIYPNLFSTYQNQFRIIEDTDIQSNQRYGRVQVVNAMPGAGTASFAINGRSLSGAVPFGEASEYTVVEAGTYTVTATSRVGEISVQLEQPLLPGQNHTLWLFPGEDGEPVIKRASNNLGSNIYVPFFTDDASISSYQYTMAFGMRFLNLCPDIPYLSYTIDNGQDMRTFYHQLIPLLILPGMYFIHPDETMYNLRSGDVEISHPYAWLRWDTGYLLNFMAYRSAPGSTPGVWAEDIPTFPSTDLIARPELYWNAGRAAPTYEPGIYTVALIGRSGDEVPADQKARIIIVKHNR